MRIGCVDDFNNLRAVVIAGVMVMVSGCERPTPPELAQVVLWKALEKIPADFVVCVSIDDHDADVAALRSAIDRPVQTLVPASECEWVRDVSKGSYHRASGKKAVLLDIKSNPSRTEVDVVARHSGLWGTTSKLKVSDDGGMWRILEVLKEEHA